jgi:hypothetical protein
LNEFYKNFSDSTEEIKNPYSPFTASDKLSIQREADDSLTKTCERKVKGVTPFNHLNLSNVQKRREEVTHFQKVEELERIITELNDVYECLKPQFNASQRLKGEIIDDKKLAVVV